MILEDLAQMTKEERQTSVGHPHPTSAKARSHPKEQRDFMTWPVTAGKNLSEDSGLASSYSSSEEVEIKLKNQNDRNINMNHIEI